MRFQLADRKVPLRLCMNTSTPLAATSDFCKQAEEAGLRALPGAADGQTTRETRSEHATGRGPTD